MKLSYYNKIAEKYREINKRDCIDELASAFPEVPIETLSSIASQIYQRKTKKTYYFHANPHKIEKYYARYLKAAETSNRSCGFLLQLADEVDLSPGLMAKLILEHHFQVITSADPKGKEPVSKSAIAEMLKNTHLIQDKHLGAEIQLCYLADKQYGILSDVIRNAIGVENEVKLKEDLTKLGYTFVDEKQLREKGFDKTPDIKLDIPIVFEGHVINWIESKASFGDEERHREYLRDQYWSYCNRFGPGLVIYWCGFIEELNSNKNQGIVISDSLPTEFTSLNPLLLMKKTYVDKI